MTDRMAVIRRWTIVSDGPDGFVEHFYAETDLMDAEVVLAVDYDALAANHRGAVEAERKRNAALVRCAAEGCWDPTVEAALRCVADQVATSGGQ